MISVGMVQECGCSTHCHLAEIRCFRANSRPFGWFSVITLGCEFTAEEKSKVRIGMWVRLSLGTILALLWGVS